jgi:hypothetical protein
MVGHLAWQEQRYWLFRSQGRVLFPDLNELLAYGKPASTPPVDETWATWEAVTAAADPWLDALTPETVRAPLAEGFSSVGTFLLRNTYHYWYHLGEGLAVRQMLGHTGLPDFVGDIDGLAPFRGEHEQSVAPQLSKEEFMRLVSEGWAEWQALLAGVDQARLLQPGASGEWTFKDVIAHITWHEREMVGLLRGRALAGSDLWNLPLHERNQAIYEQHCDLPLERVLAEAQETHRQLLEELERLPEAFLYDAGQFAGMPAEWQPADLLADNTYLHYRDHVQAAKL